MIQCNYFVYHIALSSSDAGNLAILQNDQALINGNVSNPPDNRTTAQVGSSVILFFILGHTSESDPSSHGLLSAVWLKDGAPVRIVPLLDDIDGKVVALLFFTAQESDAGDYQCIFFDNNSVVYYAITPIRLDTGMTLRGKDIFNELIIPDKNYNILINYKNLINLCLSYRSWCNN